VRVDQRVSADRWRRQHSFAYVVTANHVTAVGVQKCFGD
jgi:hypothetical protein